MKDRVILVSFLAESHPEAFQIWCYFAVRWIFRFLGPIFFSNGPSKFRMAHQNLDFCMQMNETWAISSFSWLIYILD